MPLEWTVPWNIPRRQTYMHQARDQSQCRGKLHGVRARGEDGICRRSSGPISALCAMHNNRDMRPGSATTTLPIVQIHNFRFSISLLLHSSPEPSRIGSCNRRSTTALKRSVISRTCSVCAEAALLLRSSANARTHCNTGLKFWSFGSHHRMTVSSSKSWAIRARMASGKM